MLEDFENDLPLLLGGFLGAGKLALLLALDLELEVTVEVVLKIVLQLHVFRECFSSAFELFAGGFLCHLEANLLEVVLDRSFDEFMLLPDFVHEVFEDLMRRGAWLAGIGHVQQSLIISEL